MAELNKKREYATSEFRGVNTQALRQAIPKSQQSWLENIQPIGDANAKSVPQQSAALMQLTNGVAPYYAQGFCISIGGVLSDIIIAADLNGDLWCINLTASTLLALTYGSALAGQFDYTAACQWKNEVIVFVDNVKGLYWWDGTTLSNVGFVSQPAKGQCIASYSGRVWVSNGRTIYFSEPNDYLQWRTAHAGGSFVLTDETVHSDVQQLVPANNYLYIFGVDSCNVISNVSVLSGTTNTVFTNTQLSTGVGTPFPMSVSTYYRQVWFASQTGFYAMYGASAKKMSIELDGIMQDIIGMSTPSALGAVPTFSSGLVSINNILCIAFLFQYDDPNDGVRPLMAVFFDGKWFFASQGTAGSYVTGAASIIVDAVVKGKNNLYSFDNNGNLYQLFSNTSDSVTFKWQTALWDFDQPVMYKQVTKVGIGAYFFNTPVSVNASVDTEENSNTFNFTSGAFLTFVGTGPITFVGTGPITFIAGGYNLMQKDVTNWGRYVGLTMSGSTFETTFTLAMMEYNLRSQWGN